MLAYKERYVLSANVRTVFLCGNKYEKKGKKDKRNVLRAFIHKSIPDCRCVILEDSFIFGKSTNHYLAYDDIFLKDLAQVEQLAALFAEKVIIIHETISTAAEIGMFASNTALSSKLCIMVPDPYSVEDDKVGSFISMSFLNKNRKSHKIKLLRFYPDTDVFIYSDKKSDYYTWFHNDEIGANLERQLLAFINISKGDRILKYNKTRFGKLSRNNDEINYSIDFLKKEVSVSVSAEVLKDQLTALLYEDSIRKELRKERCRRVVRG